jgi:hypothetical protein
MSVSTKMMIPKSITVGYQKRDDTYTGKLAYVIYTDEKGVLRKEKSWQSWRNEKLGKDQFDNEPRTGFVLNKKVGGTKYSWNTRNTYVRVFDPHGFEFEIQVPNLLFILQETSCIQGKGLEGEFVYAWHGTELVLLPTCSAEYRECAKFTKAQSSKVTKADMVEGCTYTMKDMTEVMYLGRHDYCEKHYSDDYRPLGPRHVFVRVNKEKHQDAYIPQTGFDKLAARTSTEASPLYADAYDKFKRSRHCDKIVEVKLAKASLNANTPWGSCFILKEADKHILVTVRPVRTGFYSYNNNKETYSYTFVRGGEVDLSLSKGHLSLPRKPSYNYRYGSDNGESLAGQELFSALLVTEKGHKFDMTKYL